MNNKKTIFEEALKNYIESRKTERNYYLSSDNVNFITLFDFLFTDSILCNNITNIDSEFYFNNILDELTEEEEEEGIYTEFYQYYIVNVDGWRLDKYKEYLKEKNIESNISLFYSDILDNYVVGISHFGTSWSYIPTSVKIERTSENE